MLYFSELDKVKVLTSERKLVGVLEDLIFSVVGTPFITKLVIRAQENASHFPLSFPQKYLVIPVQYIGKINGNKIILKEQFVHGEIGENELYVKKNLLNTQVIDIEENNIVRVNDVLIQSVNSKGFAIYGVDIGMSGALRWFRLERPLNKSLHLFKKSIPQATLAWSDIQPLELTRGRVLVKKRFDRLKRLHPADLADYLETQNFKNVMALIEGIDREYLAQVIPELHPNFQIDLLRRMSLDRVVYLICIMPPDDASDIIAQFSSKKQEMILKKLPEEEASQIRRLLKLSETPLGEFLNSNILTVSPEETAWEVIKKIKEETSEFSLLDYIYVVNEGGQLVGVFNLHELLLQDYDTSVFKFMYQSLITAHLNTPVEVAFRRMIKYKINCLPVIDEKKRTIGIVSIDDVGEEVIARLKL